MDTWVFDLTKYGEKEISNLLSNIDMYFGSSFVSEKKTVRDAFKKLYNSSCLCDYSYYAMEGEMLNLSVNPLSLVLNFLDVWASKEYKNAEALYQEMAVNECLGGDLLTSGCVGKVKIIFPNNGTKMSAAPVCDEFSVSPIHKSLKINTQ